MAKGSLPRLALAALSVVCQLASAAPARAAGRVLTQVGSSLVVRDARVAEAMASDQTTLWLSVGMTGGPGRFALVVPVVAGTAADPALDAWLEALDAGTAPRIRPPLGAPACGATYASALQSTVSQHVGSLPPSQVAVLASVPEVTSFAASQGLGFGPDDESLLSSAAGTRFVALLYDAPTGDATTETVRLTMPVSAPKLALPWLNAGSLPDVTLFTLGEGRAQIANAEELDPDQVSATWKMMSGTSDYVERRRDLLVQKNGAAWLVESTGYTPLFAYNPLPNGAGVIPPAVKSYLELAKSEGTPIASVDQCLAQVWSAISDGQLGMRVGRACAPGLLAKVPGAEAEPACSETPGAGEIPVGPLRCGAADDLAFALSGLLASSTRVTRTRGVVASATTSTALTLGSGPSASPLVTAAEADTTGCLTGNGSAGGSGGGSGSPGWGGGSGGYVGAGASDPGPAPEPVPEPTPQTHVDVSCWGGSSSNGDSCSGSSSSGSSDGDTCSGSSSSNKSSDGDTCGGSSSSGSSDGDTCGSSSSSSDGETCGSSSSGSSGESCGSGSSGGGSDCSLVRGPRPRIRISALGLALFALLLPLRRATRRREKRPVSRT